MKKPMRYELPDWLQRLIGWFVLAVLCCLVWDGLIYVIGLVYFSESPDKLALAYTNGAIALTCAALVFIAVNKRIENGP